VLHLYRPPTWHPRPPVRRWLPPPSATPSLYGFDLHDAALKLEFGNVSGTIVDLALATSTALTWTVHDPDDMATVICSGSGTTNGTTGRLARFEHASLAAATYAITFQTTDIDPADRSIASILLTAALP
jgi:hypothetical protein